MEFTSAPLSSNVSVAPQTKERAHRLFWFEKENGETFFTQEEEAWEIMRGRVVVFVDGQKTNAKHKSTIL